LAELSLLDLETYIGFLPSEIGAACVTLSRHYLDMAAWDVDGMVEKTGYQVSIVIFSVQIYGECFNKSRPFY
jgi:hypothetical protein